MSLGIHVSYVVQGIHHTHLALPSLASYLCGPWDKACSTLYISKWDVSSPGRLLGIIWVEDFLRDRRESTKNVRSVQFDSSDLGFYVHELPIKRTAFGGRVVFQLRAEVSYSSFKSPLCLSDRIIMLLGSGYLRIWNGVLRRLG